MADREVKDWITINHKHVPIYDGESKQDVYNRIVANANEEKKTNDIKRNQAEAEKLNGKNSNIPNKSIVDHKVTPMPESDMAYIGRNATYRYFQNWKSFEINEALRKVADRNVSLESALDSTDLPTSEVEGFKKTIEIMDRNMKPIDKSMKVMRFAGKEYLTSLMDKLDFYDGHMIARLMSDGSPYDPPFINDDDVNILKEKLLGAKIMEASYMSSMYSLMGASQSIVERPIMFNLSLKKGTKGMFSPTGKESEFVLARDTTYEITDIKISKVDGIPKLVIYATV